jgi:sugar O-acyltransferase (sialic acid O-acetyltransferase NeuD family)
MKELYIWGAGGHGRVVADCAIAAGYGVTFLDDDPGLHGTVVCGQPVLAADAQLRYRTDRCFVVAIGENAIRSARFASAVERGLRPAVVIHPAASVSPSAVVGAGTVVMPGAMINAGARVGSDCIVNTGAIVEHDCRVGGHVHLAPRSTLGGGVNVGALALVGIGASVIPGVTIGEGAIVGAGAVVVRDLAPHITAVGVPAAARRASVA